MNRKERVSAILKSNKAIDRKLVEESLALLKQMKKLGLEDQSQEAQSPPYSPTIRAMQSGDEQ